MEQGKQRVGIYGGSFNPVHIGHLNVAVEIMEAHALDEVWFCPARINPLRQHEGIVDADHRLNMLKLATAHVPQFQIIEDEIRRDTPSYTVDTLHHLIDQQKTKTIQKQFYLILGDDAAKNLFSWHKPRQIVEMVPLLIARRTVKDPLKNLKGDPLIVQAIEKGVTDTRIMDIHSTDIRIRLAEGRYCGHLVPQKVLDYIYTNHLYLSPLHQA
jgi:nicotinate-nucleotide adenylyltransferase